MKNINFLKELKKLLEKDSQTVTDIEMTSGNYNTHKKLIENEVPILTTDFCEIGDYGNICYFTFILASSSFVQELLEQIKNYDKIHIYGFKNFLTDLYPKRCFSYKKFDEKIKKDEYVQAQFSFENIEPKDILNKYLTLKSIFIDNNAKVINQITHNFK